MKSEQNVRDFSLRLINVVVWFEILWGVVFLAGTAFHWSGLTDQLSGIFFGSGFVGLILLFALALLNWSANLSIISKAQLLTHAPSESLAPKPGSFSKTLGAATGLIALVVVALWLAEWRQYRAKSASLETKLETIVDSQLVSEALRLIKSDAPIGELADTREALSVSLQAGSQLSYVFSRTVRGVEVYYELTAWSWHGNDKEKTKISQADLAKYIPDDSKEDKKWKALVKGEVDSFVHVRGSQLRGFRRVSTDDGTIILLIDTSRRSDYKRDSFESS